MHIGMQALHLAPRNRGMTLRPFQDVMCVSGCGRFLAPVGCHNSCLYCLGIQHTEAAFVNIVVLRSKLAYLKGGGSPLAYALIYFLFWSLE